MYKLIYVLLIYKGKSYIIDKYMINKNIYIFFLFLSILYRHLIFDFVSSNNKLISKLYSVRPI